MTKERELELYRGYIEDLVSENNGEIFYNSSLDHASIVLANIFSSSKNAVRLFMREMNAAVTSDEYYLEKLKTFIDGGGHLSILITENEIDKNSKAVQYLKGLSAEKKKLVKLWKAKKTNLIFDDKNKPVNVNFAVGDNHAYRVETDIEARKAFASFDNREYAKHLADLFDNIISDNTRAEEIVFS